MQGIRNQIKKGRITKITAIGLAAILVAAAAPQLNKTDDTSYYTAEAENETDSSSTYESDWFYTVDAQALFALSGCAIYEKTSSESTAVGYIEEGGLLYYLAKKGGWYYVESGEVRGFIKAENVCGTKEAEEIKAAHEKNAKSGNFKDDCSLASCAVEPEENEAFTYTNTTTRATEKTASYALAKGEIFVYEETSGEASVVAKAKKNSLIYILKSEGDWYYIESGNARGFVRKEDVKTGDGVDEKVEKKGESSFEKAEVIVKKKENGAYYAYLLTHKSTLPSGSIRDSIAEYAAKDSISEEDAIEESTDSESVSEILEAVSGTDKEAKEEAAESADDYEEAVAEDESDEPNKTGDDGDTGETAEAETEEAKEDENGSKETDETENSKDEEKLTNTEFIESVYKAYDIDVEGETAQEISGNYDHMDASDVESGDLVSVKIKGKTRLAIYLGDNTVVYAANGETVVREVKEKNIRYGIQVIPAEKTIGEEVIEYASQFVGNPYVWGGTSLTYGADCSGFVMSVYRYFGVSLPHYSGSMRSCGTAVSQSDVKPGDILCYNGHVALYVDSTHILHARNRSYGIEITETDPFSYHGGVITIRRVVYD